MSDAGLNPVRQLLDERNIDFSAFGKMLGYDFGTMYVAITGRGMRFAKVRLRVASFFGYQSWEDLLDGARYMQNKGKGLLQFNHRESEILVKFPREKRALFGKRDDVLLYFADGAWYVEYRIDGLLHREQRFLFTEALSAFEKAGQIHKPEEGKKDGIHERCAGAYGAAFDGKRHRQVKRPDSKGPVRKVPCKSRRG